MPKLTEKVIHLLKSVDEACFQRDSMCDTACKQERYFVGTGLVCLETTFSNLFQLPEWKKTKFSVQGEKSTFSSLSTHSKYFKNLLHGKAPNLKSSEMGLEIIQRISSETSNLEPLFNFEL